MKKYSASFLLIQTGIIFIISCIINIAIYAVAGAANVITSGLILAIPVMIMTPSRVRRTSLRQD